MAWILKFLVWETFGLILQKTLWLGGSSITRQSESAVRLKKGRDSYSVVKKRFAYTLKGNYTTYMYAATYQCASKTLSLSLLLIADCVFSVCEWQNFWWPHHV